MSQGENRAGEAFWPDKESQDVTSEPDSDKRSQYYLRVPLPPPKVLVLDDDVDVRNSLNEDFTARGIDPDCVATTSEAKSLLTPGHGYKVIFVDIKLGEDDISGDSFIFENLKLMGGAKVAAITAEFYFQDMERERYARLIRAQVDIIPKRRGFSAKLIQVVEEVIEEEKRQMLPVIKSLMRGEPAPALTPAPTPPTPPTPEQPSGFPKGFVAMLEQLLLDWLKSRTYPDKKRILHGGKLYSYNDIADEIEQGTELGQAHLKMMASLFMRTLSIDS